MHQKQTGTNNSTSMKTFIKAKLKKSDVYHDILRPLAEKVKNVKKRKELSVSHGCTDEPPPIIEIISQCYSKISVKASGLIIILMKMFL